LACFRFGEEAISCMFGMNKLWFRILDICQAECEIRLTLDSFLLSNTDLKLAAAIVRKLPPYDTIQVSLGNEKIRFGSLMRDLPGGAARLSAGFWVGNLIWNLSACRRFRLSKRVPSSGAKSENLGRLILRYFLFLVELRPLASAFPFGGTQSSKSQRQQNEDLDA